jgi:sugar lactone lactonase YvrE
MTISTLYPSQCLLGESPTWHESRKSCFWVDILAGTLYEYDWRSKKTQTWDVGDYVSLIIEAKGHNILLAVKGGLINFNLQTGHKQWLVDIDKNIPGNRCNDGACDSRGRLWVGTMDIKCKANYGNLYRIDYNFNITKMISNLTIPNGLVWSLDNERMYFIDSTSQCIKSYFYNKTSGEIHYDKVAVKIPATIGMPDGMTIDAEGMLWVAMFGGSCICRYNPISGKLVDKIGLSAINITSCQFVGENLDQLLITSARENMSEAQLEQYPESGNVFIISGMPVNGVKNNSPGL